MTQESLHDGGAQPTSLVAALDRLAELSLRHGMLVSLGQILQNADELPGAIGELANQVAMASVGRDGQWQLGSASPTTSDGHLPQTSSSRPDAPSASTVTAHKDEIPAPRADDEEASPAWRRFWLDRLRARAYEVLQTADDAPLDTAELAERMGQKVRLRTLRQELRDDSRFVYAGNDSWRAQPGRSASVKRQSNAHVPSRAQASGQVLTTAAQLLSQCGHPLSTRELLERSRSDLSSAVFRQKLDSDPRFRLCERDKWALTDWGMPEYKPLKELVADMVDGNGGRVATYEVVQKLTRDFGFKESSVKAAISSSPFRSRNGIVTRVSDIGTSTSEYPRHSARTPSQDATTSVEELLGLMDL